MGSQDFLWTFVSEGRKHDAGMLADSGILNDVGNFAFSPAGQPMCFYGDPAYSLWIHLQAPYSQGRLTQQMEDYNKRVRVSVEWFFGLEPPTLEEYFQ